jgi:hypothetical protein
MKAMDEWGRRRFHEIGIVTSWAPIKTPWIGTYIFCVIRRIEICPDEYNHIAYVGTHQHHPISGHHHHELPLDVPGGLIFSGMMDGIVRNIDRRKFMYTDVWWYGWNYGSGSSSKPKFSNAAYEVATEFYRIMMYFAGDYDTPDPRYPEDEDDNREQLSRMEHKYKHIRAEWT